ARAASAASARHLARRMGQPLTELVLHHAMGHDRPVLRRELRRAPFEGFLARLAPTEAMLEACGGAYHRARRALALGHRVRLIPPQCSRGKLLGAAVAQAGAA
ncbi:MAG: hypothetical protein K2X49_07560, partial [Acetobacteraceae bacterium]|nr:hypothetical protein [Acetobacteraceae bacterium]